MRAPTNLMAVHYPPVCCQLSPPPERSKNTRDWRGQTWAWSWYLYGVRPASQNQNSMKGNFGDESSHDPKNILSSFIISPNKVNLDWLSLVLEPKPKCRSKRTFWPTHWIFIEIRFYFVEDTRSPKILEGNPWNQVCCFIICTPTTTFPQITPNCLWCESIWGSRSKKGRLLKNQWS